MAKGGNHIASCPPFNRGKRREYIRGEKSPHRIRVPSGKLSVMADIVILMKGPAEPDQGVTSDWTQNSSDPADYPLTELPIIPGGAGWGMDQYGGSGRHSLVGGKARVRVIFVKNLNNSGTLSLESALELNTTPHVARTVIPSISGVIDRGYQNKINLRQDQGGDYVTYAGQCAPGVGLFTTKSGIAVTTSHVLIWHFGSVIGQQIIDPKIQDGEMFLVASGILQSQDVCDNVLLANCSGLFARDGTWITWAQQGVNMNNIGFWQCSATEPLRNPWGLGETHGRGSNYGGAGTSRSDNSADGIGDLRCFYGHCKTRLPMAYCLNLDLQNNLYYHFQQGIQFQSRGRVIKHNVHGSLWITGPGDTGSGIEEAIVRYDGGPNRPFAVGCETHAGDIHKVGSIPDERNNGDLTNLTKVGSPIASALSPGYSKTAITNNLEYATLLTDHVGVKPTSRLADIQRSIDHCLNKIKGTGDLGDFIVTEDDVGGIPTITSTLVDHEVAGSHNNNTAIPQPDANKTAHADGWTGDYDIMPSGYTRLEEWLHGINDIVMPAGWDS